MASRSIVRASLISVAVSAALGSNSVWAQEQSGSEAVEPENVITVTGSRTITENEKSPTPITSVAIVLFNLIADVLYGWLDPRISLR